MSRDNLQTLEQTQDQKHRKQKPKKYSKRGGGEASDAENPDREKETQNLLLKKKNPMKRQKHQQ